MTRFLRLLPIALSLVASCAGDGGLVIVDAWARPSPAVADNAALYVSFFNEGTDVLLVGADATVCGTTSLHDSTLEDGVMEMREVEAIVAPAGGDLVMEPGGLHVMCLGLESPLVEGNEFEVVLLLEDGGTLAATVSVEDR